MKATLAAVAAMATAFVATPGISADVARPMGGPGWVYIGTTHAQHMGDHDSIVLTGRHDTFRALQVRVSDAPLRLHRMMVTYDNGEPENIPVRFNIRKGGMTRAIDLHGGRRTIRKIDFWYDTKGWLRGTADVSVFGMH